MSLFSLVEDKAVNFFFLDTFMKTRYEKLGTQILILSTTILTVLKKSDWIFCFLEEQPTKKVKSAFFFFLGLYI